MASALVGGVAVVATWAAPPAAQAAVVANPDASVAFVVHPPGAGVDVHTISPAGTEAVPVSTATDPTPQIAYDQDGDLYWADSTSIYEMPAGSSTSTVIAANNDGVWLGVDRANAVYSPGTSGILKVAPGSHATTVLDAGGAYVAVAGDSTGDVVAIRTDGSSSTLVRFTGGAGTPSTLTSSTDDWQSVAVGPDDSIYVLDVTAQVVRHFSATGASLGDVLPVDPDSQIAVDRGGNLYVLGASSLDEHRAGADTRTIATFTGEPGRLAVPPAFSTSASGSTGAPSPVVATPATHHLVLTRVAVRGHRVRVAGTGLAGGERYVVKVGRRTLKRGAATASGTVSTRVRLPRCVAGRQRIVLVGATSGTATRVVRLPRRPASCGH